MLPMSGFLRFALFAAQCSETPLVSAQKVVAAWTRVGHLLHAVHTTRDARARPESYEAEKPSNNPGHNARLRLGLGCHMCLAVGAVHGDWPVSKARSCHILNLSDHLDWTLWLLRWRVGGRGRRRSLLTRQARVHLSRWRRGGKATSTRGSH